MTMRLWSVGLTSGELITMPDKNRWVTPTTSLWVKWQMSRKKRRWKMHSKNMEGISAICGTIDSWTSWKASWTGHTIGSFIEMTWRSTAVEKSLKSLSRSESVLWTFRINWKWEYTEIPSIECAKRPEKTRNPFSLWCSETSLMNQYSWL